MRQIFNKTIQPSDTSLNFDIPAGSYESLLFLFTGVNETAQTMALADLGDVQFDDGQPHSKIDFLSLFDRATAKGGTLQDDSTTGAAFSFTIEFPFALSGDKDSVYRVSGNQTARMEVFFANSMAAKLVGEVMVLKVFAVTKIGIMSYRLLHNKQVLSVSSGQKPFTLTQRNIAEIWLENNTNMSRLFLQVNGESRYNATREAVIAATHLDNQIETFSSTISKIELRTQRRDLIAKILNSATLLTVDGSGSADVDAYIVSLEYTPDEQKQTAEEDLAETEAFKAIKTAEGDVAAVEAVESLGG